MAFYNIFQCVIGFFSIIVNGGFAGPLVGRSFGFMDGPWFVGVVWSMFFCNPFYWPLATLVSGVWFWCVDATGWYWADLALEALRPWIDGFQSPYVALASFLFYVKFYLAGASGNWVPWHLLAYIPLYVGVYCWYLVFVLLGTYILTSPMWILVFLVSGVVTPLFLGFYLLLIGFSVVSVVLFFLLLTHPERQSIDASTVFFASFWWWLNPLACLQWVLASLTFRRFFLWSFGVTAVYWFDFYLRCLHWVVSLFLFPATILPSVSALLAVRDAPSSAIPVDVSGRWVLLGFQWVLLISDGVLNYRVLEVLDLLPGFVSVPVLFVLGALVHGCNFPWSLEMRKASAQVVSVLAARVFFFIFLMFLPVCVPFILIGLVILAALILGWSCGVAGLYAPLESFFLMFRCAIKVPSRELLGVVPEWLTMAYARFWVFAAPVGASVGWVDADGVHQTWTFRDDFPTQSAQVFADQLWLYRSGVAQNQLWFLVLVGVCVYGPFFLFFRVVSTVTSQFYAFVKHTFWCLFVTLLLPQKFFVILYAKYRWCVVWCSIMWHSSDLYSTTIPDYFDSAQRSFVNLLSSLSLLALFRFSPHPDEDIRSIFERLHPQIRPDHRERRIDVIRRNVNRFWRVVDSLALPEFVEGSYQSPTPENIRETYTILRDIGVPGINQEFIDSIQHPKDDPYMASWSGVTPAFTAVSNFAFGPFKMAARVFEEMKNFADFPVMGGVHTGTYNSVEAEYASTSRYWTGSDAEEFPGVSFWELLDDVWDLVRAQYEYSRLCTFEYVYDRWIKKYNLGFGFSWIKSNAKGKRVLPLKRRDAIKMVGGKDAFLAMSRRVYRVATSLAPVSTVFTKSETLKAKKFFSRSVRTVLSSAFVHGLQTSIWNYLPNHNYKILETPMQVGLKNKAIAYGNIWSGMARHKYIWAGDMTAFDSSLPPVVVKMVAEVRKRGYTDHKDHARICQLIDLSYDTLLRHPLGFKSTGKILPKPNQGFTTGHSSTSPDNSLALVVCYLYAWRKITGMRAKEFRSYNTLNNFGDDHVLGWDPVFGWDPLKAVPALADLGVIMRDECPGQVFLPGKLGLDKEADYISLYLARNPSATREQAFGHWKGFVHAAGEPKDLAFSFLAKKPIPTYMVQKELEEAGVSYFLPYSTIHDRERLIMKIKGMVATRSTPYQRATRIVSLMDLTTHHPDIYQMLRVSLHSLFQAERGFFARQPFNRPIPSYHQVLRKFYIGGDSVVHDEDAEDVDKEDGVDMALVKVYGNPTILDTFVRWVADFPTIFSPRVVGSVWNNWFIDQWPEFFRWPAALHVRANQMFGAPSPNVLRELGSRTPYAFIRAESAFVYIPSSDMVPLGSLLLRHWLFMFYQFVFPTKGGFSFLALFSNLDKFVVNAQYFLTGFQEKVVVDMDTQFFAHFVIALLSFVDGPYVPESFVKFSLPAPSRVFSFLWNDYIKRLSPLGAVDLQPLKAIINGIKPGVPVLFSAPTGVGKSTRMVVTMHEVYASRVVVILPRRLLVLGIVPYMAASFPHLVFGGGTEGGFVPDNWDVLYCTSQYFLAARDKLPTNALYVLDEAHVNEPAHVVVARALVRLRYNTVFMTATPPPWLDRLVKERLVLPVLPRYVVRDVSKTANNYRDYLNLASDFVQLAPTHTRVLVFVKFVQDATAFAENCGRPSCVVSSRHTVIDPHAEIFVSTSVADAGITIPDVQFVLTCNEDFTFSSSSRLTDENVRIMSTTGLNFKITRDVLTQRRGRTGRTSDGVFVFWELLAVAGDLSLSGEDYVASLGNLCEVAYPDLPDVAKVLLPTPEYMAQKGPCWISEFSEYLPPREPDDPLLDTEEQGRARIIAAMMNQSLRSNQEMSVMYMAPGEIPPSDKDSFPIFVPKGTDFEIWWMADEAGAHQLFGARTGGDSLDRILNAYMVEVDITALELVDLLRCIELHPLTFASMAWMGGSKGPFAVRHPHKQGSVFFSAFKRHAEKALTLPKMGRVSGIANAANIPALPPRPVSLDPGFSHYVTQLGLRGVSKVKLLKLAVIAGVEFVPIVEFLRHSEENEAFAFVDRRAMDRDFKERFRLAFLAWRR